MIIRPATPTDIPDIQTVAEHSWKHNYDQLTRETVQETVSEWYNEDRLRREIERDDAHVAVADENGVIGFSHSVWSGEDAPETEEDTPKTGTILRLYVDTDHRRSGIGSQLLDATCDALIEHDIERIEAMVLAANELGNDFYRAAGFEHTATGETTIGEETYPENVYRTTDV